MTNIAMPNQTPVQLLRRWVVDYFNSHDRSAAAEFIEPSYTLEIGDHIFAGRDEQWLPAVDQQMQAFPGMGMTVHHVVSAEDRVAVYFSEHGASNARMAVWSGELKALFEEAKGAGEFIAQPANNSPLALRKKTT